MKGSTMAKTVIAAPAKAEQCLLKVCDSVSDKKYLDFRFIIALRGIACLPAGITGA
jgi:hypothetical protein